MRRWIRRTKKLEQNLADLQAALTALIKRFGLLLAGAATLWSVVWPHIKDLPERVNRGQVDVLEDTPGERLYKIKGAREEQGEK